MRKINNYLYYKPITFDNLLKCFYEVRKTCKNKKKIMQYEKNLFTNIYSLYISLLNETYKPMKFNIFKIYEPKVRIVMSSEISDKIVNHFVNNYYLIPLLDKKLIDSNVATRKNKGTSYADKLLIKYLNTLNLKHKPIYVLKIDISKYFYSIDKNILLDLLKKDIPDDKIINLIKVILDETNKDYINKEINKLNIKEDNKLPLYLNNCGISLGVVSSQFLAVYFLYKIDRYIKEDLRCKYFIKYMDDYIILDNYKEKLKEIWRKINIKINDYHLVLNKKSNIHNLYSGFNFLGAKYKIINNKLIIKPYKNTLKRINKRLDILYKTDKIKYYKSLASYNVFFLRFNINIGTFTLLIKEKYNELKDKYNNYIIIIKDKNFYKSYNNDAIIIHYIMKYKYNEEEKMVVFGINAYDNVIDNLLHYKIGYIIFNNDKEDIINGDPDNYQYFNLMASKYWEEEKKINKIDKIFNDIIKNNFDKLDDLEKYLLAYK